MFPIRALVLCAAALATVVHGHGAMVAVVGANGITAEGMGIVTSTPRDGTRRNPFQQDTSIIDDEEIEEGRAGVCGRTLGGGINDVAAQVTALSSAGLPSMAEDGSVTMTIHQVNGDGAGPYTCEISTDATGSTFVPMVVTTNVPGEDSRSRARATDFPLVAQAPAGTTCTGGPDGDACIVRCRNGARAGPFGGCAVVTNPETAATSVAEAATSSVAEAAAPTSAATSSVAEAAAPTSAATSSVAEAAAPTSAAAAAETTAATTGTVADVANAATNDACGATTAAVDEDEEGEEAKKLVRRFFDYIAQSDYSRKRMLHSRIVHKEGRGMWI